MTAKKPTTPITQVELERLRKDAERYRWLSKRMVGAHFNFDDEGMCVLAFQMPGTIHISASCDRNVDMAMTLERQS